MRFSKMLELNKKTQIFKSKQGVNFCGYKINEYRLKIRDKGKRKLKKKIKKLNIFILLILFYLLLLSFIFFL